MDRSNDAERLRKLYEHRVPEGMSQEQFGKQFGVGNQSMVSQYLSGHRPLNLDAAAKFAKGLRCTIADISPGLATHVRVEIFPVLGRVSIKAALALAFLVPPLQPTDEAKTSFNIIKIHIAWRRLLACLGLSRLFVRYRT